MATIEIAGPEEVEAMREHSAVDLVRRLVDAGPIERIGEAAICFWCGRQMDDRFQGCIAFRPDDPTFHKPNCPYIQAKEFLDTL